MAAEFRIFGKEVTIRLTQAGKLLGTITAIKNFVFQTDHRIISEGYLGETSMRQDEIFDGVSGSFSVNPEDQTPLLLQQLIATRAQRRIAQEEEVNCTFRAAFPNGQTPKITIPDMHFDPIPFNVGARDAYVEMSFSYKASKYILTPAT